MRHHRTRFTILVVALLLSTACTHTPPTLSPTGAAAFQANQAVVALGTVQSATIQLNKVQVCTAPDPCHPLVSDANRRTVVGIVGSAVRTLEVTPNGWKTTTTTALDQIDARLDASGKGALKVYVAAAREILATLQ